QGDRGGRHHRRERGGYQRHLRRAEPARHQARRHARDSRQALAHDEGGKQVIPAAFEYARASSVEEAAKLLSKYGEDAKVLAGGHSLIPLMRLRLAQPTAIVDITYLAGLDTVHSCGTETLIGTYLRNV